jgi:hypothetical protein
MSKPMRYVMGKDGNPTRMVGIDRHSFGEPHDVIVPGGLDKKHQQLGLVITKDKEVLWVTGRRDEEIQMTREEALELMELLQRTYPLDSLGRT